jgi:hypothetical protein
MDTRTFYRKYQYLRFRKRFRDDEFSRAEAQYVVTYGEFWASSYLLKDKDIQNSIYTIRGVQYPSDKRILTFSI